MYLHREKLQTINWNVDHFQQIDSRPSVYPGFTSVYSTNRRSKTVFLIHSWESVDVEGWLYALFHVILYHGLEHLWILVSARSSGTNHPCTPRDNCMTNIQLNNKVVNNILCNNLYNQFFQNAQYNSHPIVHS